MCNKIEYNNNYVLFNNTTTIINKTIMTKIHVMSDLHLEFNYDKIKSIDSIVDTSIDTSETILILAGDIGYPQMQNYWDFLNSCAERYMDVIFITGNHEYYSDEFDWHQINNLIESKQKPNNLHFLNKSKLVLKGITFLGTTGWTHIPPRSISYVVETMNDYEYIQTNKVTNKLLTTTDVNTEHDDCIKWLESEITNTDDKIIIITHHLPTFSLIDKKYSKYHNINCAFASDLTKLFDNKIKFWVCGHTHTKTKWTYAPTNTTFIINPFGYEGENEIFNVEEFEI